MNTSKLKDRIDSYYQSTNYKLISSLPTIININGRNFSKNTSFLGKPFDEDLSNCFLSVTLKMCSEIEGVHFAYQYNDEIILICQNNVNSNQWYDGNLQKTCSAVTAAATLYFNENISNLGLNMGGCLFLTNIFQVPSLAETVNTLVYKQQHNFLTSIQFACFYELLKKYDKNTIKEMLSGLTIDEKIDLLKQETGVDFNDYPLTFRRGAGFYKIPKLDNGILKNKWTVDTNLPIFTKDQSFLTNKLKF